MTSDQLKSQGYFLLTIVDQGPVLKNARNVAIYGSPGSYMLKHPDRVLVFATELEQYQYQHFKEAGLAE